MMMPPEAPPPGAADALPSFAASFAASYAFVSPLGPDGRLSAARVGKDVLLTDLYGLPAAWGYLLWRYARDGSLRGAWPPSAGETAAWAGGVALLGLALPAAVHGAPP